MLFDLDGTLADTAGDLGGALNQLRLARGLPPLPLDILRPYASAGARGLIGVGLDIHPGHAEFESFAKPSWPPTPIAWPTRPPYLMAWMPCCTNCKHAA